MGWREEVAGALLYGVFIDNGTLDVDMPGFMGALKELAPAARIALARELLAGVGYHAVVIPDEWDIPGEFGAGWNACRAAMLGEDP